MIRGRRFSVATHNENADTISAAGVQRLTKRNSRQLAAGALIGAAFLAAVPAAAQASPTPATMTISSDVFPSGATLAGALSGTVPVVGGSPVSTRSTCRPSLARGTRTAFRPSVAAQSERRRGPPAKIRYANQGGRPRP